MRDNTYTINIFKKFKLETPVAGVVKKVISPKGTRTYDKQGNPVYKLKSEHIGFYTEVTILEPGLYHVLDICKPYEQIVWNHYLFIIETKGNCYPVAEYLEQTDSAWIKQAISVVKSYFSGEKLYPIQLTRYEHEEKKPKWSTS